MLLIDEVHTPDSSRFWKAETYKARLAAVKNRKCSIRSSSAWRMRGAATAETVSRR